MSGQHLISDEETRKVAEGFLEVSPWIGDIEWEKTLIGPDAEMWADLQGNFPSDVTPSDGVAWSWKVSFSDPSGAKASLSHELVLEGLRKIIYGEHSGSNGYRFMRIQQWFTEPTDARQSLRLRPADHSAICQYALYGKTVFPTGEKEEIFGKKFDLFEDQRAAPAEGQPPTGQL